MCSTTQGLIHLMEEGNKYFNFNFLGLMSINFSKKLRWSLLVWIQVPGLHCGRLQLCNEENVLW
jgi:hypothetical protein